LKRDTARVHFAWVVLGGTAVALLARPASAARSASQSSRWRRSSAGTGRFGNYTLAFQSAAFVAFAATLMDLVIRERPASCRPPAMAVAPAAGG
jgi:hypothetical protein